MSGNTAQKELEEIAFNGVRETGASVETAAKTIGRSYSTGKRMESRRKVLSLTEPRAVNSAVRTIKKLAAGKAVTKDGLEPPPSVTLAAAKEITDRAEPKVTMNQNLNLNVPISPVDLSKYKD